MCWALEREGERVKPGPTDLKPLLSALYFGPAPLTQCNLLGNAASSMHSALMSGFSDPVWG